MAQLNAQDFRLPQRLVLDGGMATALEAMGQDLSDDLWSARVLAQEPGVVRAVHEYFFAAGAQVAITASYQVSEAGFEAAGFSAHDARAALHSSVRVARQAAEAVAERNRSAREAEDPKSAPETYWVAGSVGPYGAHLGGGEEYTGEYLDPGYCGRAAGPVTHAELVDFHMSRMYELAQAGADLLACETIPALAEVDALIEASASVGLPTWITLTSADGLRTRRGELLSQAFWSASRAEHVVGIGVNCGSPAGVLTSVRQGAAARTSALEAGRENPLAVVAYPNSGETWNGETRQWEGQAAWDDELVDSWIEAGASWVGGCCRVGTAQVRALREKLI